MQTAMSGHVGMAACPSQHDVSYLGHWSGRSLSSWLLLLLWGLCRLRHSCRCCATLSPGADHRARLRDSQEPAGSVLPEWSLAVPSRADAGVQLAQSLWTDGNMAQLQAGSRCMRCHVLMKALHACCSSARSQGADGCCKQTVHNCDCTDAGHGATATARVMRRHPLMRS